MAAQFESLLHPFVILFTIPLAFFGSVAALVLLGISLSIVVFLGMILLAGIVVNNAIVLVDYINVLRARGLARREAIVAAGAVRLRPILMTTGTTVLGLLPMALGLGDGAELRTPLAVTVIAGLVVSTLLTLVVIPVVYDRARRSRPSACAGASRGSGERGRAARGHRGGLGVSPHPDDRTGRLVSFSLRRPIAVCVVLASALVLGLVATLGIPVELIPRGFEEPFLRVVVPWRDAPAPEVLDKIVRPLEEELATVGGIDRINSLSLVGSGRIFLRFKQGTDMDVAYREVRDRVERGAGACPPDVERVFMRKDDDSGIPIYVLGLAIDDTLAASYDLMQNEIVLPLERVDGVAAVGADGLVEKEILIELDRKRAAAAGVNIWDLAAELGRDNFTLASGAVRAADRKLLLRSQAVYDDLAALENRPVSPTARLRDIASVRYDLPE
jgi:multidrug efflux pump subunit AcrB